MTILFDTNVIIDILWKREPFFSDSYNALRKSIKENADCLLSAASVTDIFYILRKTLSSASDAKLQIEKLSHLVTFADVLAIDIHAALTRDMQDFENAVVDAVAERNKASYIITRNTKDFVNSAIPAVSPTEFLKL